MAKKPNNIVSNSLKTLKNGPHQDFPGGPVVRNLPAKAGDTGSIPGPGRFHMPQSNKAGVPQLLKHTHPTVYALKQEKPLQ